MEMILKTTFKNADKLEQIRGRLNYIQLQFDVNVIFDNTIANRYKLIVDGKESIFTTYSDVIHALDFLINCGESK